MTHDPEVAEDSKRSRGGATLKVCAACGTEIDPSRRHLAASEPANPSTVYLFCSSDCRTEWFDD